MEFTPLTFTTAQQYLILKFLNEAYLRTDLMRANYNDQPGAFYVFDAQLNPTEYQKDRPVPLLFQTTDIFPRLANIEALAVTLQDNIVVQMVLDILTSLQNIESAILTERSSANSALIQADVLKWDVNQRLQGMLSQRDDLIEKMRYQLGLPPSPDPIGGSSLARS